MTSLPTWAVYLLSFGSPAVTAAITALGVFFNRRAARELEDRSRREEAMRIFRWAAEMAVSDDAAKAHMGVVNLESLIHSQMLPDTELALVDAALKRAIEVPRQAIIRSGGEVEVIVSSDADVAGKIPVSSGEEDHGEEADTQ